MKYLGEPNLTIINYENNRKVFQFNENGEFETTDVEIIKFMKKYKSWIKAEDPKELKCKYCGETFTNKGLLLAHYRKCKRGGIDGQ